MTTYKYLGWGETDENGVAHLDHDANGNPINHSYTGVGAGEVDVVASLDNPIDERSIVSETYSVWDYIKYDYATSDNHNDIWTKMQSNIGLVRGDEYSTLSENTETYAEIRTEIPSSDCVIEMDVKNDGMNGWITSLGQGTTLFNASQLTGFGLIQESYTQWTHLKIEIQGTTIKAYYNNETTPRVTRTNIVRDTSKVQVFGFTTPQTITTIDFKDFKVYPL